MRQHMAFFQQQMEAIKDFLTISSPFRDSIENQLEFYPAYLAAQENWAKNEPTLSAVATVAEKFDNLYVNNFYELLSIGMFIRMIRAEMEVTGSRPQLEEALRVVSLKFENEAARLENDLNYSVIPIQKLVRVQLGAGLLYAGLVQ